MDENKKKYFSKSPQTFSYSGIREKFNFKPRIKNNSTYLHDLSCTLAINLKEISEIKNTEIISIKQMDIIRNKIAIITELFKNYRKYQKNSKNLRSKILVHNQLLQEINRDKQEEIIMLQEKKNELNKANNKKEMILRKFKKKFNEIEIFIRRESLAYEKYQKFFYFSMDSFINKNTKILTLRKNKKDENERIVKLINFIKYQNKEYKNIIKNNENDNKLKINSLKDFLKIKNDKNEYFSEYLKKLEKLYKKIGVVKLIIELEDNLETKNVLINLGILNLDNYSRLFKSDSGTINFQENSNPDSSELWSASEIEK